MFQNGSSSSTRRGYAWVMLAPAVFAMAGLWAVGSFENAVQASAPLGDEQEQAEAQEGISDRSRDEILEMMKSQTQAELERIDRRPAVLGPATQVPVSENEAPYQDQLELRSPEPADSQPAGAAAQ